MSKVYVLTGWSSVYQDPGFEDRFSTLEEAKRAAIELLEKRGQPRLGSMKPKRSAWASVETKTTPTSLR